MTEKDERIQQWLDQQLPQTPDADDSVSEDIKAYRVVFDALNREPEVGLPYGLSLRVQRLIFRKKQEARQKLLYALLGLGAVLLVTGGVVVWQNPSIVDFPQLLPGYYLWPVCFGTFALVLVHAFEYRHSKKKWLTHR